MTIEEGAMDGGTRRGGVAWAGVVVALVTILAVAFPGFSPLYAVVYPPIDARSLTEALTPASVHPYFEDETVTQFETSTFRADVAWGTELDPELPTVDIAYSNVAVLTEGEEGTFEIVATSRDRQNVEDAVALPDGGSQLTWTWEVRPLLPGEHTLLLSIQPTVVVEGEVLDGVRDINETIKVTVDVNPVQRDFEQAVAAAGELERTIPSEMTVGQEHEVTATLPITGDPAALAVEIELTQGPESADLSITPRSSSAAASIRPAMATDQQPSGGAVTRSWTVVPLESGRVSLVFTTTISGDAAGTPLADIVEVPATAVANAAPPSVWEIIQQPVLYITPFVALAGGILVLWGAWRKSQKKRRSTPSGPSAP